MGMAMEKHDGRAVARRDYGVMHGKWYLYPEFQKGSGPDGVDFFMQLHRVDHNGEIFLMQRRIPGTSVFELIVIPRLNRKLRVVD
jgi:hypothetical protein